MQTQDQFVEARQSDWTELESLLPIGKHLHQIPVVDIRRVGLLYRSICADLMRARAAGYSPEVVAYLDALAARSHNRIYGARPMHIRAAWQLLSRGFPRALRRNRRYFALAAALFVVPLLVGLSATLILPGFAAGVLPQQTLDAIGDAYAEGFDGRGLAASSNMAGFYVYNNIGIAFRCFATGILFGLGSVFFLVYNGVVIGTVLGYVIGCGHAHNILTFVCGHSALELTAIVVSGGAGLQLGHALIEPNGLTRWASLQARTGDLVRIIMGAAAMLAAAALVEGYWSPSSAPAQVKWAMSVVVAMLVAAYLSFAGRSTDGSADRSIRRETEAPR